MMVNPALATLTRVNGTVILLFTITSLLIARAIKRERLEAVLEEPAVEVVRHRAAA
jgi:hypothetical protein